MDARLSESTRERELVETESSIRIFEKSWGWAKLVLGIAGGVVALLIAGATYESINLRSAVKTTEASVESSRSSAEKSIGETAEKARTAISVKSSQSLQDILDATGKAQKSSDTTQKVVKAQEVKVTAESNSLRSEFQAQAANVTKDVSSARQQIQAASQLQPQMTALQQQLKAAQLQIQEQQRVITSSEDFAKKIYSSHRQFIFDRATAPTTQFAVVPSPQLPGSKTPDVVALYLLLPQTPVGDTVQIQFNQTVAAPNSFGIFHNLLVTYIQKEWST